MSGSPLFLGTYARGTLCAVIGLLAISCYYAHAWRRLRTGPKLNAIGIPYAPFEPERQGCTGLRYLQWGVFYSVLFFMVAAAADAENDWLFRLAGALMGFAGAICFAMFGVGFIALWNLWKELVRQLKQARTSSLLLSTPLAILCLGLGLAAMVFLGMVVEKAEKLPKLWQFLLGGPLYVVAWVSIANALFYLWMGRSTAALALRMILMVFFSVTIVAAASFSYWWIASQTALALVLLLSAIGTLNVTFYSRCVRPAARA